MIDSQDLRLRIDLSPDSVQSIDSGPRGIQDHDFLVHSALSLEDYARRAAACRLWRRDPDCTKQPPIEIESSDEEEQQASEPVSKRQRSTTKKTPAAVPKAPAKSKKAARRPAVPKTPPRARRAKDCSGQSNISPLRHKTSGPRNSRTSRRAVIDVTE